MAKKMGQVIKMERKNTIAEEDLNYRIRLMKKKRKVNRKCFMMNMGMRFLKKNLMLIWKLNRRCVWHKKIRTKIMNKNSLSSSMVKRKKEKREMRMKK